LPTRPKLFTPTQRDIFEGIERELLRTQSLFRQAIMKTKPNNPEALEAVLDAAEPVATAQRAVTTALGGDMARARDILEESQVSRNKKDR